MSTLAINTLTGQSSASSINVRGEGSANTNLQQGLAKFWHQTNASSGTPATQDSLNLASITDNGVGNFTFNFTSNMGNNDYSFTHYAITSGYYSLYHGASLSVGTSSLQYRDNQTPNLSSADVIDHTHINDTIHGDLA
tara:strand:- start:23 stop:436 length:414 start_codon:yes stop_codon:yes gene_type:complete